MPRNGAFLAPDASVLSGARILVADDDPDLLDTVVDALTRLGTEVTRAVSGAELIEHLANEGPFDLVVTDVAMPWMNGVQAMHAVRSAGLGTPVIVMTALRDEGMSSRVKALGGSAMFLPKPFTLAELESVASTLLTERSHQPVPDADA